MWLRSVARPRFSLRSVLIAISLVCIAFGLVSIRMRSWEKAIGRGQTLREFGAEVVFAWEGETRTSYEIGGGNWLLGPEIGSSWTLGFWDKECHVKRLGRILFGDRDVIESVKFNETVISSDMLDLLFACGRIRHVSFHNCEVGPGFWRRGQCVTTLCFLELPDTVLEDFGWLENIACSELLCLNLRNTGIEDDGLRSLARFENLRELNLSSNNITNRSIHHLSTLTHLQLLDLRETNVDGEGLDALSNLESTEIKVGSWSDDTW